MKNFSLTNNYLKNSIVELNSFLENQQDPPEEVFFNFIKELGVSNLFIPGEINEDALNFEVLQSDDDSLNAIPLFTDVEEFINFYESDDEYDLISNEIEFYVELVRENDLDAVVINPGSENFILQKEVLVNIPLLPKINIDDSIEGYSPDKLYKISRSITNDSLVDFIHAGDNNFEALMLELTKANLLNLIASEKDLSGMSEDGIISLDDVEEFAVCTTGDEESQFAIVFTSLDNISQTMGDEDDLNYYYQFTLLDEFIDFILKNDMDGLIINPGIDDYLITREYLLEAYGGLTYNNPNFKKSQDYAFII